MTSLQGYVVHLCICFISLAHIWCIYKKYLILDCYKCVPCASTGHFVESVFFAYLNRNVIGCRFQRFLNNQALCRVTQCASHITIFCENPYSTIVTFLKSSKFF